ncbi:unnamed protein product [Nesidiocoris tenuis]|uniref:Uncharacterized protein n=1 Tax=Nesidiocoris tenuis TaxID=355587 RepID=A0A6H5HQ11_9HEMI|nr:unnamed protein product [Nesidiocoris tenuis]
MPSPTIPSDCETSALPNGRMARSMLQERSPMKVAHAGLLHPLFRQLLGSKLEESEHPADPWISPRKNRNEDSRRIALRSVQFLLFSMCANEFEQMSQKMAQPTRVEEEEQLDSRTQMEGNEQLSNGLAAERFGIPTGRKGRKGTLV